MPADGAEVVDIPALAAAFGRRLGAAGVPVTPERSARFARALALVEPQARDRLYWTARTVLVSGREQLDAFDAVFGAVFEGHADPAEQRGDPTAPPPVGGEPAPGAPLPQARSVPSTGPDVTGGRAPTMSPGQAGEGPEQAVPFALASAEERLQTKSFAELDAAELAQVQALMARLSLATPLRRTRRKRRRRRGEHIDVRATIRASLRTAGDPVAHKLRRRRERRRRLVVLCDISGSMEPYARAYVQFLASAARAGTEAEAFVFATRLTRLTRALRAGTAQVAIQRATATAPDWSGGTRIGEALKTFNDRHARRGMARGAIVVILSDGWERGDPALVGREMARLHRLAHRIIWVNPRVAARGFAPATAGMAAALPYCDALLSGHSLRALERVAEAVGGDVS